LFYVVSSKKQVNIIFLFKVAGMYLKRGLNPLKIDNYGLK